MFDGLRHDVGQYTAKVLVLAVCGMDISCTGDRIEVIVWPQSYLLFAADTDCRVRMVLHMLLGTFLRLIFFCRCIARACKLVNATGFLWPRERHWRKGPEPLFALQAGLWSCQMQGLQCSCSPSLCWSHQPSTTGMALLLGLLHACALSLCHMLNLANVDRRQSLLQQCSLLY